MPSYLSTFMSHAHADNSLTDPYAEALKRLGVPLYYDRVDPQTGHFLGDALEKELARRQTLLVMVTPAAIASFWVKLEINTFLGLMAGDPARKLIPVRIAACQLPAVLNGMWWVDALGRPVAEVMADLARALELAPSAADASAPSSAASGYSRVVDWRRGMGDHTTITAAIAAAQPGERILIRKGLYEGGLTIDKPLELVGDGHPGDVEVHASGTNIIKFTASQGRVANLTLRQTGGGNWFGVDIAAGRLELADCDISSQSLVCVAIHGSGAHPILRRNRIHDGQQAGVVVYEQGQGLLEDNDIFANAFSGVEIMTGGAPTLRHNRIHENKAAGVHIYEQGQGLLEDNDIVGNALAGVAIVTGGAPTLRRNRIHENKQSGVFVYEQGQGLLEDNDIFANTFSGIQITTSGAPTLRHNRIHENKESGVVVYEQGQGLLEDNDIVGNAKSGVEIKTSGAPTLRRNRIHKNGYWAIWVYKQGGGVFEGNDLRDNTKGPWSIDDESKANVTRSGNVE